MVVLTDQAKNPNENVKLDPYLESILKKVKAFMDYLVEITYIKCKEWVERVKPNHPNESIEYLFEWCLYAEKNLIRGGILMQFLDKHIYLNEKIYGYPRDIKLEFQRRLREIVDGGLNKIYPSYIDPIH